MPMISWVTDFLVDTYRYLGVHLDKKLDWKVNTEAVYRKGMSRGRSGSFMFAADMMLVVSASSLQQYAGRDAKNKPSTKCSIRLGQSWAALWVGLRWWKKKEDTQ